MKKVLILYAAYGGGHLNAANSLKKYIEANNKDIEIEMIDCIKYISKSIDRVTTRAYKELAKTMPWAWEKVYDNAENGMLSRISTHTNKILSLKLKNLIEIFEPDLIISTHPFSSQMVTHLKATNFTNVKLATVLTDFVSHSQWLLGSEYTNYYFVATEKVKNELIEQGIPQFKIHATGIPVSNRFLTRFRKANIIKKLDFSSDKPICLFFGGGEFGLGKTKTLEIFEGFISQCSDLQIVAVAGRNKKMFNNLQSIVEQYNAENRVKVFGYSNKIPELMSISKFVVTKPGGLTSSECLVSGTPMIIINPIPGQEEANAEYLVNNNHALWIKKDEDINFFIQENLITNDIIAKLKNSFSDCKGRNSAKEIIEIIKMDE